MTAKPVCGSCCIVRGVERLTRLSFVIFLQENLEPRAEETLHADAVQQLRNKSEELLKRLADLDGPSPWIQASCWVCRASSGLEPQVWVPFI